MKIVFAGTSKFSCFHLELLLKSEHEISLVLTQPDRKSGRGKKIMSSPVKVLALKNKIEVLQPDSIKNNNFISSRLMEQSPDIMLVVAYGLILPKEILQIPKLGCINVHASLLPRWRGASPIERCIQEGDKESGITFMRMDEGLDSGTILDQFSCLLNSSETSGSLKNKLKEISRAKLIKFLKDLSQGKIKEKKQDSSLVTYAKKISSEKNEIKWEKYDATFIDRKIRSLSPKYGAYTFLDKRRIKIFMAKVDSHPLNLVPGKLKMVRNKELHVGCSKNSSIEIVTIQPEGKKSMLSNEFIKGNKKKLLEIKKFSSLALEN